MANKIRATPPKTMDILVYLQFMVIFQNKFYNLFSLNKFYISIKISEKELAKLLYTPNVYIVNLVVDGTPVKAILKDLQCDFVTDRPVHVDFYQITEDKPVVFEIPVKLNGLAEGVRAGGKLALNVRKLAVKALYTQFPDTLDIDVTNLALGKTMKVGELSYEGLEIITSKEVVVCAVRMTRAARAAAAEAEASEE